MKRKYFIISFLISLTIVLIVSVRLIIQRDNSETQDARIEFYSELIDIQWNLVSHTLETRVNFILAEINSDLEINQLISDPYNDRFEQKMNKRLKEIQAKFDKNPQSRLTFVRTSTFAIDSFSKKAKLFHIKDSTDNNLQNKKTDLLAGFQIQNDSFGYKIVYPVVAADKTTLGYIEFGIQIELIKKLLVENSKKDSIGFLYLPLKSKQSSINNAASFKKLPNKLENVFVDKNFDFTTLLLDDSDSKKRLNQLLNQEKNEFINFALLSNSTEKITIFTFKEIALLHNTGKLFLVSINHDTLLEHTKHINSNLFVIYFIIVILGMTGIAYLTINRINIIRQNRHIKKSEQKLLELNQTKDKFFSIVAHDLKNPFNGIMGMSGYLTSDYDNIDDEERKEIINDINISSKNAYNLLQNLLEWTRAQNGYIKNNPEIIDPQSTIELALETVTNLAKNKQIEIIKTINTKAKGWADENLLSTVIRNLTTNAVKFSPRNSTIEILVKDFKKELVFCVIDKGIGLHEDEIDKLFRIDVNFHKLGTEKESGTGLGLKLCKEFVEYCGGKIWVVSEPGQGCSFYFTIPKNPTSPA